MAVAFGTIQTNTANGGNLTITKPTSLAAGDLMLAWLFAEDSGSAFTAAGWSAVSNIADAGSRGATILAKVADSTDAAAANFTFTNPGNEAGGALMRITGSSFTGTQNIVASAGQNSATTNTPSYTGITTRVNNDLVLILLANSAQAIVTASAYAVANNNPTWTEQADFNINFTEDGSLQVASATYATAGATGNFTATLSSSTTTFGYILSISETQNGSGTNAPHLTSPTFFSAAASSGTSGTNALFATSPTFFDANGDGTTGTDWTNLNKPSTTWNNPNK